MCGVNAETVAESSTRAGHLRCRTRARVDPLSQRNEHLDHSISVRWWGGDEPLSLFGIRLFLVAVGVHALGDAAAWMLRCLRLGRSTSPYRHGESEKSDGAEHVFQYCANLPSVEAGARDFAHCVNLNQHRRAQTFHEEPHPLVVVGARWPWGRCRPLCHPLPRLRNPGKSTSL